MGLFDKLTGTRHPPEGVPPVSAAEVKAALLGLNRDDVPYVISDGASDGAHLMARWRMAEPAWQAVFVASRLSRAVRVRMRLDEEKHEVRALEEQWEVTWVGDPPQLAVSSEYSRGPDRTFTRHWSIERGDSGRYGVTETFRFDGSDLRGPLRDSVLTSGWTWRGVVFGSL